MPADAHECITCGREQDPANDNGPELLFRTMAHHDESKFRQLPAPLLHDLRGYKEEHFLRGTADGSAFEQISDEGQRSRSGHSIG